MTRVATRQEPSSQDVIGQPRAPPHRPRSAFVATLAGWQINATAVDVVIALSVVFVGVVGLFGRPTNWRWFGAAVGGFGLVHGLGLATRLQDLGLPEDGQLARVIAFNVGVEVGQLVAVVLMFTVGDVLRHYLRWSHKEQASHVGLVTAGVVAALLLAVSGGSEQEPASASSIGACEIRERTETYPGNSGHPLKDFFEPTEPAPGKAFGHVIGDGFVIVHYRSTLPADQVSQLRAFVTDPASGRVVGGAAPQQAEPVKAVNAYDTLVCEQFDLDALRQFTSEWFDDPRSRPIK